MPKLLLIDMDGPLADFEGAFLNIWQQRYPSIFSVPLDKRRSVFLRDDYPEDLRSKADAIIAEDHFFLNLPVVAGSQKAVREMLALGYSVFLCTSAFYINQTGLLDKRLWAEKHFGYELAKTMIFTKDKTIVRGDYLIDDKPLIDGIYTPSWKHIVFDQPFNQHSSAQHRIRADWSNWKEAII